MLDEGGAVLASLSQHRRVVSVGIADSTPSNALDAALRTMTKGETCEMVCEGDCIGFFVRSAEEGSIDALGAFEEHAASAVLRVELITWFAVYDLEEGVKKRILVRGEGWASRDS